MQKKVKRNRPQSAVLHGSLIKNARVARHGHFQNAIGKYNYLISTFAPASSSCFLKFSASSLDTPSFRAFGADSTKALASARPRPAISRTALMTVIFLESVDELRELQDGKALDFFDHSGNFLAHCNDPPIFKIFVLSELLGADDYSAAGTSSAGAPFFSAICLRTQARPEMGASMVPRT